MFIKASRAVNGLIVVINWHFSVKPKHLSTAADALASCHLTLRSSDLCAHAARISAFSVFKCRPILLLGAGRELVQGPTCEHF